MQIKEQNNTKVETKTRTRASTKTILGVSGTQPRISRKWSRHYEELTSMREEVLAKNQTLARDASTSNETSLSDFDLGGARGTAGYRPIDWAPD